MTKLKNLLIFLVSFNFSQVYYLDKPTLINEGNYVISDSTFNNLIIKTKYLKLKIDSLDTEVINYAEALKIADSVVTVQDSIIQTCIKTSIPWWEQTWFQSIAWFLLGNVLQKGINN